MQLGIFLLLAGIVIFMGMRGGCGGHIGGHGRHDSRAKGHASGCGHTRTSIEQTTDPVCGKAVDKPAGLSAIHAGAAYYFCSQKCRDEFAKTPERYIAEQADATANMEHHHG
ncbi:MAG: YHS domain-containing protein [Alphaproteobacteria bacterium]